MNVYFDGSNHVVAESPEDAREVYCDEIGAEDDSDTEWQLVPDDEEIAIMTGIGGSICSQDDTGATELSLTAREWIERELPEHHGKGFLLCSEDV